MPFISALEKKFFGNHPRGLPMLFMSEFWERFSFYGMRALLVLYMTKIMLDPKTGFVFTKADAYEVYGAYGALVYAFPVLGGFLADRFLGYRRAIGLGGVLMAIGHFLMAVESPIVFFLALAFLCVGNGFFKPNISSTVGRLYKPGDNRRDSGFTIFYMGINFGAMLAPLICGTLGETVSWHLGFSLAGIGMVCGLLMFMKGRARLEGKAEAPREELLHKKSFAGIKNLHLLWLGAVLLTPAVGLLLNFNDVLGWILNILGIGILAVLIGTAIRVPKIWGQRMAVLIVLMFFHIMFWAFFEQAGSSLTTLADKHADRVIGDTPMPASDVGKKEAKLELTQALWGRKFKDVEIKEEHEGLPFSGFDITQPFVGTTFKDVKVEFQYGGARFKDYTVKEGDVDKTFGELKVELAKAPESGLSPQVAAIIDGKKEIELGELVTGPGPFADRLRNLKVGRQHINLKLMSKGDGPEFEELMVTPDEVGVRITQATVTKSQVGKSFDSITVTSEDSDEGKVIYDVTLDESHVGMGMGGVELKASQFQMINPFFIVLLAPLFSMLWLKLGRLGRDPSTPLKFALAMFQIGLGFYVLRLSYDSQEAGKIAASWLVVSYLFQTTGELCLSPVGLSAVTRLAPPKIVGFAMGAWFLTIAFAHHFAAQIAKLTTGGGEGVSVQHTAAENLKNYTDVFEIVAMSAAAAGVLLLILTPFLKKLMHEGVEAPEA